MQRLSSGSSFFDEEFLQIHSDEADKSSGKVSSGREFRDKETEEIRSSRDSWSSPLLRMEINALLDIYTNGKVLTNYYF
jgi:hypothetical protein